MRDHGGRGCISSGRRTQVIASKIAASVVLVVLVLGGLAGYTELRFRKLNEALAVQLATYKRQRWERPAVRGNATEGNAALEARHALQGFSGLQDKERDGLASQLFYGMPLTATQHGLLERNAVMLDKLRAATQLGWAMTEIDVGLGIAAPSPNYRALMDAALLLLGRAASSGPDECVMIATDVMRLGQDLVPGAPLEAASMSARLTSVAAPVVAHCLSSAPLETLTRAARELAVLAQHPPPSFGGIEVSDLELEVELLGLSELFPKDGGESPLRRLRHRPVLFETFERLEEPAHWRALSPAHYPQTLETWLHEQNARAASGLPLLADATSQVQGFLYDDMRGQALLRALTVGAATLAERARRQRMPREPLSLNEPALCDPYTGQPLKWRIAQDGSELTVWSVGEDRRDDKGSSEWTTQAPIDVVVHLPVRPLAPADAPKRSARK